MILAHARRHGHTHTVIGGFSSPPVCGRRLVGATTEERFGADALLSLTCPSCLGYAIRRGWFTQDLIVTDLGQSL